MKLKRIAGEPYARSKESALLSASITSPLRSATSKRRWHSTAASFDFKLRGKGEDAAFIDLGDQFLALQKGRRQAADDGRHFGSSLMTRRPCGTPAEAGVKPLPGRFPRFLDPWGNRIEINGYDNTVHQGAERSAGMGSHLSKNEQAIKELRTRAWAGLKLAPVQAGSLSSRFEERLCLKGEVQMRETF